MDFVIENFFEFKGTDKTKAAFSVKTSGGMYYDMKLIAFDGGYFVSSNQQRSYDKKDGSKGYTRAFGAIRDTPAASFFDAVAAKAAGMLTQQSDAPTFRPEDEIPF